MTDSDASIVAWACTSMNSPLRMASTETSSAAQAAAVKKKRSQQAGLRGRIEWQFIQTALPWTGFRPAALLHRDLSMKSTFPLHWARAAIARQYVPRAPDGQE